MLRGFARAALASLATAYTKCDAVGGDAAADENVLTFYLDRMEESGLSSLQKSGVRIDAYSSVRFAV